MYSLLVLILFALKKFWWYSSKFLWWWRLGKMLLLQIYSVIQYTLASGYLDIW